MRPLALSVAGSDPSGGAGIQADLATFAAWGCHGMAVPVVLTAQNTTGVRAVHAAPAEFVGACLDAIFEDCPPRAVKTGMLHDAALVGVAAARLAAARVPVIVDPVMVATSGDSLLREDARAEVVARLLPLAALVTPNVPEAEALAGMRIDGEDAAWEAARRIVALGARAVLVKGGHLGTDTAADLLLEGSERRRFPRPRIPNARPHGAGCALSAAIAAALAHDVPLGEAVGTAGDWVHAAIRASRPVGRGAVPLDFSVPAPRRRA